MTTQRQHEIGGEARLVQLKYYQHVRRSTLKSGFADQRTINQRIHGFKMSELCATCCAVLSKWDLEKYPGLHSGMPSFEFGSIDEIQTRKDCPLCQLMLSLVPLPEPSSTAARDERDPVPTLAGQVNNFSHIVGDDDPCDLDLYLNGKLEQGGLTIKGLRLGSLTTKQLWQQGAVEPSISSVKWEVHDCQTLHRKDTLHDHRERPWIRIRLIDVLRNNICERAIDERFLALSYVWGGIAGLQASRSNRANSRGAQ